MRKIILLGLSISLLLGSCIKTNEIKKDDPIDNPQDKQEKEISSIRIEPTSLNADIGDFFILKVNIQPQDADHKTIKWESTDNTIATVNKEGKVEIFSLGEVDIIASHKTIKSKCRISVTDNISVEYSSKIVFKGDTRQMHVTTHSSDSPISWTSSNKEIATVDKNGCVSGLTEGKTKITASLQNNKSVSFTLNVRSAEYSDNLIDARDNHTYKTVKYGNQIWMAENLAYLPSINKTGEWSKENPNYYVFMYEGKNIDEAKQTSNYIDGGVLYNFPSLATAAPEGWHVPSQQEWEELERYCGLTQEESLSDWDYRGDDYTSHSLKSQYSWLETYQGSNASKFNIKAVGRFARVTFTEYGFSGRKCYTSFWTSSKDDYPQYAAMREFGYKEIGIYSNIGEYWRGYSVRCIKNK